MNPAVGTGAYADAQETGTRWLRSALLVAGVNLSSRRASTVERKQQAS